MKYLRYRKRSRIAAPASVVFAFHERPDAFALLAPPWQKLEIIQPPKSLAVGTRVIVRGGLGPISMKIVAEHIAYDPGKSFVDTMVEGPFPHWVHRHSVEPDGEHSSFLEDDVEYALPLGALGRIFGAAIAHHQLERMFTYRHEVTRRHCEP